MEFGHVGILTVDLHLPDGSSLKTKRKELLRVKSALARRFACAVAEVDHHELWQRARLTLAVVGREAGETDERVCRRVCGCSTATRPSRWWARRATWSPSRRPRPRAD